MNEKEISISPELLEKVLSSVTPDAVLVGGQALFIWVSHYKIDFASGPLVGSISDDADFLGNRSDVAAIAHSVSGKPKFPTEREMTALVGQVKINVTPTEFVNVDVLHRIVGMTADMVKKNASEVMLGETRFFVMHPLHVLLSRVENLAQLEAKQNEVGVEQTRLATLVAREYITQIAKEQDGSRHALKAVEQVVSIAKSSAGKKASRQFGISFFSAIPKYAIENETFHVMRWPRLCVELNEAAASKDVSQPDLSNWPDLKKFVEDNGFHAQQPKTDSSSHIGKILWTDGQQAVQALGRDQVMIHDVSDWPDKPEASDESRTIRYKDGIPELEPLPYIEQVSSLTL